MLTENTIDAIDETEKPDREATFDEMVKKAENAVTAKNNYSSQENIRFGNYFLNSSGLYYDTDSEKETDKEQDQEKNRFG